VIGPLLLAGAALFQDPCRNPMVGPSPWYASLVASYHSGDRPAAISADAPPEKVRIEIAAWGRLVLYRKVKPTCPIRPELEALSIPAAVMLHTDRAFWRLEWDDIAARAELVLAPLLLELMDDPARRAFEPRWARASALELGRHGRWDRAQGELERAVTLHPDDPLLLLARGAVLESRWRHEHDLTVGDQRVRYGPRRPRARAGRALLERAEGDYRQALALRKDLLHARVRLGRVLQLLDQTDDSIRALQAALADPARLDARDVYLAHLFLGSAHEQAGVLDRAAAEYERAVSALPEGGQAAAVALSHALHRSGRWPASLEALQAGVARAGRRLVLDPWWPYVAAQTEDPAALFEDLRKEVSE
jgi:tetratricopeptide (TPR) repeat protein